MLWTVQTFDKIQEHESESSRQKRLLWYSEEVALILLSMGFPLDLPIEKIVLFPRKLPVDIPLAVLSGFQLMLISFTGDEYSKLEEPEKAQLRAFLERYLRFMCNDLNDLNVLANGLSGEELKQFRKAFDLECHVRRENFMPAVITHFVEYLYWHMKLRCPAFLLKKKFDFYSTTTEEILSRKLHLSMALAMDKKRHLLMALTMDRKHYLLMALIEAREMVIKDTCFETGRVGECPDKVLVCSQIKRAISGCKLEISRFFEKNPEAKEMWEETSSGKLWATFKKESKEACADLSLTN